MFTALALFAFVLLLAAYILTNAESRRVRERQMPRRELW
jgi:hypothetical protein